MRAFSRAVDRFCVKHPRFGIRNLMIYIIIANAIVWVFSMMDHTGNFIGMLQFSPYHILHGQVWRLFTFAFIPQSGGLLLLIELYFYYFIGSTLERQWGSGKFTIYYLMGIVLTVLFGFILYWAADINVRLSAQYINLSMFFAFAMLYPDMRVLLFFFIPIKIKWLALVDLVYFIAAVVQLSFPVNLVPVVAILNCLLFCMGDLLDYFRPIKARNSKQAVNFRREARRIRQQQQNAPYKRKCAVCGRTDTGNPNLEFRYCSRCQGFHCFCEDHINNHVHFTE